jgi:hypothetical protein
MSAIAACLQEVTQVTKVGQLLQITFVWTIQISDQNLQNSVAVSCPPLLEIRHPERLGPNQWLRRNRVQAQIRRLLEAQSRVATLQIVQRVLKRAALLGL